MDHCLWLRGRRLGVRGRQRMTRGGPLPAILQGLRDECRRSLFVRSAGGGLLVDSSGPEPMWCLGCVVTLSLRPGCTSFVSRSFSHGPLRLSCRRRHYHVPGSVDGAQGRVYLLGTNRWFPCRIQVQGQDYERSTQRDPSMNKVDTEVKRSRYFTPI